jgi:hypothetical protein
MMQTLKICTYASPYFLPPLSVYLVLNVAQ